MSPSAADVMLGSLGMSARASEPRGDVSTSGFRIRVLDPVAPLKHGGRGCFCKPHHAFRPLPTRWIVSSVKDPEL